MKEEFKEVLSDGLYETMLRFSMCEDGMNILQVLHIKVLIENYLKKYPGVSISKICDYYNYDHQEKDVNDYIYTHNDKGESYKKMSHIALYSSSDRVIAFNHIQCNGLEQDDMELMNRNKIIQNMLIGDKV